jgi:hypothetical protein|nr:MAG TPA: hypothetical protein [Caudoviricetes sp.]
MSKGIVRLICDNGEKVMSLLLSDNIINFDYEYADNVPGYDVEFRIPFTQDLYEMIKDMFHRNKKTHCYLSAGKLYGTYEVSFRLNSNDLIVDETRPEGHIALNNPPKYKHFEGNVRGYFAAVPQISQKKHWP